MKAVHVDGTLYVMIAVCGAVVATFSTDDAYKYVNPYIIFWSKAVFEVIGAGAGALKMFRSTGYSDSLKDKLTPPPPPANIPP